MTGMETKRARGKCIANALVSFLFILAFKIHGMHGGRWTCDKKRLRTIHWPELRGCGPSVSRGLKFSRARGGSNELRGFKPLPINPCNSSTAPAPSLLKVNHFKVNLIRNVNWTVDTCPLYLRFSFINITSCKLPVLPPKIYRYCLGPEGLCPTYLSRFALEFSRPLRARQEFYEHSPGGTT